MTSVKSEKTVGPKKKAKPELTDDEKRQIQQQAEQVKERRAETQLDLARLFLEKEQPDIAMRRLKEIVADYDGTTAATEAKSLIRKIKTR